MFNLIIQIAGTSGSGKSHLMRSFLDAYEFKDLTSGYKGTLPSGKTAIILGRYEVPTGGCDTIRNASEVYALIKQYAPECDYLLYEGLFVMNMTRGPQLLAVLDSKFIILQLTTPLVQCISSINSRRAEKGKSVLAETKNTSGNYGRCISYCNKMRDAGAILYRVDRDAARAKLFELVI